MLPIPSASAVSAFMGLALLTCVGIVTTSSSVVALGSTGFAGLAWVLAATMPQGRRLRRLRLEFAWWLDHGSGVASGAAVPGAPFDVRCYVRHRGREPLDVVSLEPLLPVGVEIVDRPTALRFAGSSRTEFKIRLRAPACGRVVLHGLALTVRGPFGLFSTPLYFPNPLVIKILPRAAARRARAPRHAAHTSIDRSGRTMIRRRGGGTELHELRDFVSGDPFKSIAWKASARRGRLLVKEVEQEVQQTRWVLLDVSGTMRGGDLGQRKLDYGVEAMAAEARSALDGGDRVGFIAFGSRIVAHVAPREGRAHMIRIYDALLSVTEIVDEDLTDIDDARLVRVVLRYVRQQDGIDFSHGSSADVGGLVAHVRRSLEDDTSKQAKVKASTPTSRVLRRFCRARGLLLPYRATPADHAKASALGRALQIAGGQSRVPLELLVLTDLDSITDFTPVTSALELLKLHGHRVRFVLPDGRAFAPPPRAAVEHDLHAIYGLSEERRLREARQWLGRLGVRTEIVLADTRARPRPPRSERAA